VRVGGAEREVAEGGHIDIDRGVVHAMWNPASERAVMLWQTRPALRTEQFFEAVAALMSDPQADPQEGAALVHEFAGVFRPAPAD
jgi:hypothetical protein